MHIATDLSSEAKASYRTVNGNRTFLLSAGEAGLPVILLHGLGGSTGFWRPTVEALARDHRVYAPDLLGFGNTDKPDVTYSVDEHARFTLALMDGLGIERAAMVGSSAGGILAAHLALKYPERTSHLVLVNSGGLGPHVSISLRLLSLPFIERLLPMPNFEATRQMLRSIFYRWEPCPELIAEVYEAQRLPGARRALFRTLRTGVDWRGQIDRISYADRLSQIKAPTMIVWGQEDRVIPVHHAHAALAKRPDAKLVIFPRCGHCPPLECPDAFNRALLDFLAPPP